MTLSFSPSDQQFRAEVQDFLAKNVPQHLSDKVRHGIYLSKEDHEAWHRILNRQGWLAPHWPTKYGGAEWSYMQSYIFDTESAKAYAPKVIAFGLSMLGPTIIKYGTEQQKQYWLPRILNGDDWWCQGFSEPEAGSDLANLKTKAEVRTDPQGTYYILNGQKTWTTYGQMANMMFCLARTGGGSKKQEGISFFLVDMAAEGVEVRPIITLDGAHEVNEVFLTDVRVPADHLIGELGQGWTYAKYLLTYERTSLGAVGLANMEYTRLLEAAHTTLCEGKPLAQDPQFRLKIAKISIELANMSTTNLRILATTAQGQAPNAESSMLKIRSTEIRQEISALLMRAMGSLAQAYEPDAFKQDTAETLQQHLPAMYSVRHYLNSRKLSIYGGSNEIQKNIIAKMMLGL